MLYLDPYDDKNYNPLLGLNSAESFKARTLYENLLKSNTLRLGKKNTVSKIGLSDESVNKNKNNTQHIPYQNKENDILHASFKAFTGSGQQQSNTKIHPFNIEQLESYRQHLPENKAILYFFTTEHKSILWLLSKNKLRVIPLP